MTAYQWVIVLIFAGMSIYFTVALHKTFKLWGRG